MLSFLSSLTEYLHPIVVYFPIVLFTLSFLLAFASRFWQKLHETEWLLLVLGAFAAPVAVITGTIAHLPYEKSPLAAIIEPYPFSALIGTLLVIVLTTWCFVSRRKGKDIGQKPVYLLTAAIGLLWITLVGGTGGQLVYNYAINVRGTNPLLP